MPRRLPDGTIFLSIQYSVSSRSNELAWVTARLTTSSETSEVYWIVKPSSSLALSASSLNWLTPVPAMRSVTGSAACTAGKPRVPSATPVVAAAPSRTRRRVRCRLCMLSSSARSIHHMCVGIVPADGHAVAHRHRIGEEEAVGQRHAQLVGAVGLQAQLDDTALVFDRGDA